MSGIQFRVWPGKPYPLGASWDGSGVNFALFSESATTVELCLFDSPDATSESHKITLPEKTDNIWHAYLPDVRPGQVYGYRIHGPYDPAAGHRTNPHKIVLDPYAKSIARRVKWDDRMFSYTIGDEQQDLSFDKRDSAAHAPLAAVIDPAFDWQNDVRPNIPWHKTLIYELHVKGFSKLHPDIPEKIRGTFAALTDPASIRHFKELGVTAVELMPVHHHTDDRHLVERSLTNYWGYNTLSFFAPDLRYASTQGPQDSTLEFKKMVRGLHAEGIEVILDVVYNHTAEGSHLGPTLSFRGIDNVSYYRLMKEDPRYYEDFTGCGNTLNMRHPRVLQLLMDSLRYWVLEMHVDGFRFDLASALARELFEVDKLSAFFDVIHQDPVLSQVKLIAEPWDVGEGGYQVGNFPVGWAEWNGKYRDCVRSFWKGDGGTLSEFATRLCGSSDLYEQSSRRPYASINFVTSHDGFSLHDLVSYNDKHNEANGEKNQDGDNHNLSWNCGAEGPTDDAAINALRQKQKRNFIATLMLSQGVPMLRAGDELGQSQLGNNNAYCQDNPISWIDWKLNPSQNKFLAFARKAIAIWRTQPVLKRRKFFQGLHIRGSDAKDITWLDPSGAELSDEVWNAPHARCVGICLSGNGLDELNEQGEKITGDTILILFNAYHEAIDFVLPNHPDGGFWQRLLDTALEEDASGVYEHNTAFGLQPRSVSVFRACPPTP